MSGVLVAQAGAEDVAEEVVIPEPLTPLVESDEEQVCSLEALERRLGVGSTRDGSAQRSGQPGEDRRVEEEPPDVGGLTVEDLVDEVVDDEPVVAGEFVDPTALPDPAASSGC